MRIQEIKEARDRADDNVKELLKSMKKAFKPTEYKGGTSYNDYDTIHGSRKEYDIVKLNDELQRLIALRDTYYFMLNNIEFEIAEDEVLKLLKTNKEKVNYLRIAKEYTQQEVADRIGLSVRSIQRIEKVLKDEGIKNS